MIKFLKKNCDNEEPSCIKIRTMCNRLYLYPLITTFCFIFATIHRMYQIFALSNEKDRTAESNRMEMVLYLLHGMFISIRGFLYFIIYGCDAKVKDELSQLIGKCFRKEEQGYVNI